MKVSIVGANGQIGQILVDKLHKDQSHEVRAIVRKAEQAEALKSRGIDAVVVDLEESVEKISVGLAGSDAVVFTAGSGGKTGPDKTLLIDLDGAVKCMEACEQLGIKRFIIVSAHQAHNRENWAEVIKPYYVAKHYADRILMTLDLDYTIIRPGGLLNEPGIGKVAAAENLERGTIPREDVAETVIACLNNPSTIGKDFDLISGDSTIEDAVKRL